MPPAGQSDRKGGCLAKLPRSGLVQSPLCRQPDYAESLPASRPLLASVELLRTDRVCILGIVLSTSQRLQEGKQGVWWPGDAWRPVVCCGLGKHLLFHGEISFQIDVRGLHRLVTEPEGDDRGVYAG